MNNKISFEQLENFRSDLDKIKNHQVNENAISHNGILAVSKDYRAESNMDPVFSINIDTGKVADQKRSGRCWMFAALNTFRHSMREKLNLKDDFELSQNYTFFWDKLEKANFFYENVIKTADLPTSDRKVAWLMQTPQQDGGQWDMIVAIIQKYGIVPQAVMPETHNSSDSSEINKQLNLKLRKDAVKLRELINNHTEESKIRVIKEQMLSEVYRMLAYCFGEPPTEFSFEYYDRDNQYHRIEKITPQDFFKKYVGWNLDDYVSIINAPTEDKPFNHMYTVDMLGNVLGGRQVRHLNVDMHTFRALAIEQLKHGESVWFGSDVGQESDRKQGIMDTNLYHQDELFDIDFSMSKAERLDYGESLMTHAMVLTGVDLVDDQPTKWKVENSWGDKVGEKGFFVMSDDWMEEFCYQIVINKKYLPKSLQKILNEKPRVLNPWDPMGSLA